MFVQASETPAALPGLPLLPTARRVLIYRLGSLGDTVIALPCFHLVARCFPDAERALLTNVPIHAQAPAAAAVLGSSGLVHRYFRYPVGVRNPWRLARLALTLRRYRPDVLVYLAAPRGEASTRRDLRFFRLCGIRHVYGAPTGELAVHRLNPQTGLLEPEATRLARTLFPLGDARLGEQASWELHLTDGEKAAAAASIQGIGDAPFIVCAPGCKAPANDWEDENWASLFQQLSRQLASNPVKTVALVLTGAESERSRNERLLVHWEGPRLNVCGNTPREAAALTARALFYLGPDSGPMHIAAAVGTACVSIFSSRLGLGIWFPRGSQDPGSRHQVFYHRTSCSPCGLDVCTVEQKRCLLSIRPEQVLQAILNAQPGWTGGFRPADSLPGADQ